MLQDTRAKVLITHREVAAEVPVGLVSQVIHCAVYLCVAFLHDPNNVLRKSHKPSLLHVYLIFITLYTSGWLA